MLDAAAFIDLRNFIKRRINYGRYRVGSTWYNTTLSQIEVMSNGTVRAQLNVNSGGSSITVNRVELHNSEQELWAHQDCNITLTPGQTGILFWFDFTLREEVTT